MSLYKHIQISEAMKEHSELMTKIRDACKEEIAKDEQQFNDDLFLLRFCLSQKGDFEKTKSALSVTIKWRTENKELLEKLKDGTYILPEELELKKYVPADAHKTKDGKYLTLKDGSPLIVVRSGLGDVSLLMQNVSAESIKKAMIFGKERLYQHLDAESRKCGRIIKVVSINDMKRGSIFDFNMDFMRAMGAAATDSTFYYPCLLGASVIINPLSTLKAMSSVVKLLLPASVLEKMQICNGASTLTCPISTCPVAKSIFDLDNLPSFLGGRCECKDKGGCIGGIANDQKEKLQPKV